jgi:hypothetical protein
MYVEEERSLDSSDSNSEKPGQTILPSDVGQLGPAVTDADEFRTSFGETLDQALDLSTWHRGEDLAKLYGRLEQEIAEAVKQEDELREQIRKVVFPRLQARDKAPKGAGVYRAEIADIEKTHRGLLFNGQVEACDGTSVPFDTLPITILQIGVCTVSYRGDQGSWVHRLYRRDLRLEGTDPVAETLDVLERRQKRSGYDGTSRKDKLSELARRGVMTFAERSVLMNMCQAPWRMGHGNPTPYELLTGASMKELLDKSLALLSKLVEHKRFVFVPSAPADRLSLTIGNALQFTQYAIIDTLEDDILRVADGHYWPEYGARVKEFGHEYGKQIIKGVFRASEMGPAQMFYAHIDHAHQAALIALADSVLQDVRGFPMLIDLADMLCRTTFGRETLAAPTQTAYAEAGEPFRYVTERQSRR